MFVATIPYSRLTRLRNEVAAAWKWVWSFRKREWQLSDYPIRIAKLEQDSPFRSPLFKEHDYPFRSPLFKEHDYRASIINWAVMGSGVSHKEALESLRTAFEKLRQTGKQNGTALLRPGSRAKLEFASQDKISAHRELSEDFAHPLSSGQSSRESKRATSPLGVNPLLE